MGRTAYWQGSKASVKIGDVAIKFSNPNEMKTACTVVVQVGFAETYQELLSDAR